MRTQILEIACFNPESAIIAQLAGADRIELCSNYKLGGLTPHYNSISELRNKVRIPLHVIIRPRANGFVYTGNELTQMKNDVAFCKENKVDGIVFGVLNRYNQIDLANCKELLQLAGPMSVTFHRAIDQCDDLYKAFENLIALGVDRVLTSGGAATAAAGIDKLKELQKLYGGQILIMPGGGIRSGNLKTILKTGCVEYHSSAVIATNSESADAVEIKTLKQLLK